MVFQSLKYINKNGTGFKSAERDNVKHYPRMMKIRTQFCINAYGDFTTRDTDIKFSHYNYIQHQSCYLTTIPCLLLSGY